MVEWQPVNEKGITESEDYHLVKPLIIIDSGKIAGESLMRERVFT